jgi:hypothetical protein
MLLLIFIIESKKRILIKRVKIVNRVIELFFEKYLKNFIKLNL